jgi:dihydroxyacetone kinase
MRVARSLLPMPQARDWTAAFREAVAGISALGGAKPGDRTMLDALVPAADAFARPIEARHGLTDAMQAAAQAAKAGMAATADMLPWLSRASCLGVRAVGVPDAGAAAVAIWLQALAGLPAPDRPGP